MLTGAGARPCDFPYDPALPGTRLLQRPNELTGVLSSLLANSLPGDAKLLNTRVGVRHYVPGKRCVAEVDLVIGRNGDRAQSRRLMIKLYPSDKGPEVYTTLLQLRSRGFAAGRLTVPHPLAYDPTRHFLVLCWVRGESLRSLLLGQRNVTQALERAAQWLLKLHTCGASGGRRYDFGRHLHTLSLQGRHLTEAFPEAGPLFSEVLRGVEERGRGVSDWKPAPTHRDFTPDHLLFNGEHLTALDFDEFCQYDPLFDVGHFLAHLRVIALRSPSAANDFERWAEHFQAAYKTGSQDYSPARILLYQGVAYLKLAYVIGVAQSPPNWDQLVTALLHEAQRLIYGGRT